MTTAYIPPGVTVQELTQTTLTPLLALPGSVCLVGVSSGVITRTDTIQLFGTGATALPGVPANSKMTSSSLIQVIDAISPSLAPNGYVPTTDYTFTSGSYSLQRVVTAQTLATNVSAEATSFTLSSGATPANGQIVSLSNQVASFTGDTHSDTTIDNISSMSNLAVGQTVLGTNIPGGTTILAVDVPHSSITISNRATTTATGAALTANALELVTVQGVTSQTVSITSAAGLVYDHSASSCVVTWGTIPDGTTLYVTYTYTPSDYFTPIRLTSMSDIQNRFGDVWDPTGTVINSPLSFAANMAFQNGASNVVLQPLYYVSNGKPQQPTATQAATPSNWATVFTSLLTLTDINLLVPVVGQSAASVSDAVMLQIEEAAQDFVFQAKAENVDAVALVGEDSSTDSAKATEVTLQSHAQTLLPRYGGQVSEQVVFVNTSNFLCANVGSTLQIGGQYVAAAVAGMLSSQKPSATITRHTVAGVLGVTDQRNAQQKNTDASNGMLVIENRGNVVQVRHGITLDMTSAVTREINVVRAKHFVIASIRNTLETEVIGKLVADADAPTLLNNVVIGTLEELRAAGDISDYSGVASQITSFDPTTMAVQFAYRPIFIVNYIQVLFSLDLSTQTVTATSTTAASSVG